MSTLPAKVLLATDGSEEAVSAARAAAELCGKIGSELHVVHVGPRGGFIGAEVGPVVLDPHQEEEFQKRLDEESRKLLDEQVRKIEDNGGSVTGSHLRVGNQADNIVRLAEEIGADTIIMGSRGHGGVRRALMGSVSEDVVRHAHCPVLVMRGHEREALFPARIVLAVDGSRESDAATSTAASLASSTGSELYVVHAGPMAGQPPYHYPYLAENVESFLEQAREEVRKFLEGRTQRIREQTDAPVHTHVRLGKAQEEIVELAEEIDAGLVVLGSRGLGGIKRALMGSVSDSVVRHARCPVLVVRTEDAP